VEAASDPTTEEESLAVSPEFVKEGDGSTEPDQAGDNEEAVVSQEVSGETVDKDQVDE